MFRKKITLFTLFFICTLFSIFVAKKAQCFELEVIDAQGKQLQTGYGWLLQLDTTYHIKPGVPTGKTLSTGFHRSYAPVVKKGTGPVSSIEVPDPNKHYFLSILPNEHFSMGGAPVPPNSSKVVVKVNKLPLPTAQITVFVFRDEAPVNGQPDLPQEKGLEGFSITVEDAAGRYGPVGGQLATDAFGNPLGTTYNNDGTVAQMGSGVIKSGPDGYATIKNLPPGKYGIQVIPPVGQEWHQTSTIEGTKVIDAWVKANEPAFFQEFGPPGPHVFIGFVKEKNELPKAQGSTGSVSGTVVSVHTGRPPNYAFFNGMRVPNCWIGLNDMAVGRGKAVFIAPCQEDSTFNISNIPPGNYQLAIWDENLDYIFGLKAFTVPQEGGPVDIDGDGNPSSNVLPVFSWFGRLENKVFLDLDQDGFRDPGETGIAEQNINIRFRDGTIYNFMPTDINGDAPLEEVFPFFSWLVAEVDYGRFKPTGVTVTIDDGGPVAPGDVLNPQVQPQINPNTGNALSRTETGPVLTEAFQLFLGQTNRLEWGKAPYAKGENGGISGIVYYATTRAEDDPRFAAAEPWEPGIPRVQVNLYQDSNGDGIIDYMYKEENSLNQLRADVDNYPFGNFPGHEDIDRNNNGIFDPGSAIQITYTDSWDDSLPTGCVGPPFYAHGIKTDCFDGLRVFNQVRPGVFDGGYLFDSYFPFGMASGSHEVKGLPPGTYIVEAVPPPGYEIVKEEDKNVEFGDTFKGGRGTSPEAEAPATVPGPNRHGDTSRTRAPVCVGEKHVVPELASLFPSAEAPFAGETRPLCDMKQVTLADGFNAAADFFFFTEVPVAAQVVGFILNDFGNEFDPNSPNFGEKFAPPWLPISIRDWTGQEIARTYSDEWGRYNALLPSTYTVNVPSPSGVSPNMITVCLNNPGPIEDPNNPGTFITDPFFDKQYSQFCYTFQYMPGTTTYLDTPVIPIAAFAEKDAFPLDCEFGDGIPVIWSVSGPQGGPYVDAPGQLLTITSKGNVQVPNPLYDGPNGSNPKLITRDFGFGTVKGVVTVNGIPLQDVTWTNDTIRGTIAPGTTTGQLEIIRGDNGKKTRYGVTVNVGAGGHNIIRVAPSNQKGATPIQDAIDQAQEGDLILVAPGQYEELVIMWKNVRLQGWGAPSTIINAVKTPAEKLTKWRVKIESLVNPAFGGDQSYLLENQKLTVNVEEPVLFNTEAGAGITVIAKPGQFLPPTMNARIDGFTITGSDQSNGIFVNGNARYLEISNNIIINNSGIYGGGIRFGHPFLTADPGTDGTNPHYVDANNHDVSIHHNVITANGARDGVGGGISISTGTDGYSIVSNYICGNFSAGDGGGIGQFGQSHRGKIADNQIIFNQSFNQGRDVSGGGIFISGAPGFKIGKNKTLLSPGTGSIVIDSNVIQGNNAGAGDGGGIRIQFANGMDVVENPFDQSKWNSITLTNNMLINNSAGYAGGAISLQDAVRVFIIHDTIARNDSTATTGLAMIKGLNRSESQPAGIVSYSHTNGLLSATSPAANIGDYSDPVILNSIVWQNRSFYWDISINNGIGGLLPLPDKPVFWDLAIKGSSASDQLHPTNCILTDVGSYPGNFAVDPGFVQPYFNGARQVSSYQFPEVTVPIQTVAAFDEGGNFISLRIGPLSPVGDYHLAPNSPAIDKGSTDIDPGNIYLQKDIDGDKRPLGMRPDIGADERQ